MRVAICIIFSLAFAGAASQALSDDVLNMKGTVSNLQSIPGGEVSFKNFGGGGEWAKPGEVDFLRKNIYQKFHPNIDKNIIGFGRWTGKPDSPSKQGYWGMNFKVTCGKNICLAVDNARFSWLVTLSETGQFIDAALIYGTDSEIQGHQKIREMSLDTYFFESSGGRAPYEGEGAQTNDLLPLGLSDTGLLCNRFSERFMPGERQGFSETRVYHIKRDGHFELVQTGSCILSDEKISELGLTELVKKAKDGSKRPSP